MLGNQDLLSFVDIKDYDNPAFNVLLILLLFHLMGEGGHLTL